MKPSLLNIIHGTDPLIEAAINSFTGGSTRFRTKTSAQKLSKIAEGDMKLASLTEALWEQIGTNWIEMGCRPGGELNWRWNLQPMIAKRNKSPEKMLEKALANSLPPDWANQVPTSSGLVAPSADKSRNLDLAHRDDRGGVTMIELKIATDTPVYAAFEIVRNALLLCLVRASEGKIRVAEPEVWLCVKTVNLRVLAPRKFYAGYRLGWFERELDRAVAAFRAQHAPAMNFRFRAFDAEPTSADDLLKCLKHGKIFAL